MIAPLNPKITIRLQRLSQDAAYAHLNNGKSRCKSSARYGPNKKIHSSCKCGRCFVSKSIQRGISLQIAESDAVKESIKPLSTKAISLIEAYVVGVLKVNLPLLLFTVTASVHLIQINLPKSINRAGTQVAAVQLTAQPQVPDSTESESTYDESPVGLVNDISLELIRSAIVFPKPIDNFTKLPVIAITPPNLNFGQLPVGTTTSLAITVSNIGSGVLSGTASVESPFTIVSGGSYDLRSNQVHVLTVNYSPTLPGRHAGSVFFAGGGGAVADVKGSAWAVMPGLNFSATAGTISYPFVVNASGYISQTSETTLAASGQAVYGFMITNAGDYTVAISVNAANTSSDSVFINIDGEPTDSSMIWDVLPLTSGFEMRTVGWRGMGDDANPQFANKTFTLAAGTHRLILRGLEANTQIGQIYLLKQVQPPSNLRLVHN